MDITNRPKCFWRKAAVIDDVQMISGPLARTVDTRERDSRHEAATSSSQAFNELATTIEKWLLQFPNDFFAMISIDEAHHSAATV